MSVKATRFMSFVIYTRINAIDFKWRNHTYGFYRMNAVYFYYTLSSIKSEALL